MEPLRKALRLPRVNLFIADDTGLGKTIEAGLIARELLLRKKAKTIVVAVPPSVLEQWKAELEERFGLVFETLDRGYLTRMRRERGFGVNPWRTHSCFLVSHNLLVNPKRHRPRPPVGGTSCGSGEVSFLPFWVPASSPGPPVLICVTCRQSNERCLSQWVNSVSRQIHSEEGFTAVNLMLSTFPCATARSSFAGAGLYSSPGQRAIASNSSGARVWRATS